MPGLTDKVNIEHGLEHGPIGTALVWNRLVGFLKLTTRHLRFWTSRHHFGVWGVETGAESIRGHQRSFWAESGSATIRGGRLA